MWYDFLNGACAGGVNLGKGQKRNVAKWAIFWLWEYDIHTHCMRIWIQTSTFKRYLNIVITEEVIFCVNNWMEGGGGGYPTSKWQSHLKAITQRGHLVNDWISGLSENNLIFLNSLLYLNNLITCLVLSDCSLSGHVSSNCIHSDKQAQTRQNKPLHHFKQIIKYFAKFFSSDPHPIYSPCTRPFLTNYMKLNI